MLRALVGVISLFVLLLEPARGFDGKVINVHDGDTITVLRDGHDQVKVRLNQIDAPELGQAFGQASRRTLARLVAGKTVQIDEGGQDKYGRTIGTVFVNGINANSEMVRLGMAWAYRKYLEDPALLELEEAARNQRLGLWEDPNAIAPWEWRHKGQVAVPLLDSGARSSNTIKIILDPAPQPRAMESTKDLRFKCGQKRFCKQMTSCEEARFFYEKCGLSRLDRDGDGVPCENVCR